MENREVARILLQTAQLLEIDGAPVGRYRSYERAAELLSNISERVEDLAGDPKQLMELPGIGEGLAGHIQEILKTGDYSLRRKLLNKYPETILHLLDLQSLGPKKVALIWKRFHAGTVEEVARLAREGKLRALAGFGEKSEQNILRAAETLQKTAGRFLIHVADETAQALVAHIRKLGRAVDSVDVAGSLRRRKETIGDLDLLVSLPGGRAGETAAASLADHILEFPGIEQLLARGENKISFRLDSGLQVDVRLLETRHRGAALLYFTGSKEHNVTLRGRANKMGYTLNEYALATLEGERPVASETEAAIYKKLGLAFIEPELRENTGEIEAAEKKRLPELVELGDIRGDLQMHTVASDGRNTIEEMAQAAARLGYQYIALTDHSKAVTVANGLDEKRTVEQIRRIADAARKIDGIHLLAGSEVDILKNGRLDLDDEVLAQLDVVVCSVHSFMNMERGAMTERLLAAIENPYTQIIAHPTGRLLLRREAFPYDMEKILDAAGKHGVAMECNAYPDRLDLNDVHLRMAKERGVKITISTDAHTTKNLEYMKYGVGMARRGWIERRDVLNTLPYAEFRRALRPKPGARRTPRRKSA
ncbi:MAG TPA: DNA polymerase/3'-5' exonuclease PolX [Candidatus Dormibacteraeota bacterium]|nr:DNA polymerase/3'-5' exonuclease PolX [Candidatus Dormibacteraeota bacterium]